MNKDRKIKLRHGCCRSVVLINNLAFKFPKPTFNGFIRGMLCNFDETIVSFRFKDNRLVKMKFCVPFLLIVQERIFEKLPEESKDPKLLEEKFSGLPIRLDYYNDYKNFGLKDGQIVNFDFAVKPQHILKRIFKLHYFKRSIPVE